MTNKEILSHIDHTLLKQFATWEEIKVICDDAIGISNSVSVYSAFLC